MMRHWSSMLVVFAVLGYLCGWEGRLVEGVSCVGNGPCGCTWDDGSGTIDISSIGNTDNTPRFRDIPGPDGNLYYYNPCQPFKEGGCSGAAVCQYNNATKAFVQLGDASTVRWMTDRQTYSLQDAFADQTSPQTNHKVTAYYEHEQKTPSYVLRESFVTLVCDPLAVTPWLNATGSDGTLVFYFTLTTICACPNGCGGGSSGSTGLSGGSVLLIIFFVCLTVYLTAGMLINCTKNQATGVDLLPNADFWRNVPGLIKDGCLWVSCQYRAKETYTEVN